MKCHYCQTEDIPKDFMASKRKCNECFIKYQREYQRKYQRERYQHKNQKKEHLRISIKAVDSLLNEYVEQEDKEIILKRMMTTCVS